MGRKVRQKSKEEKKMKIRLNNKFYNKGAVAEALDDFKGVCKGKILNNRIDVQLKPKRNVKNIKEEFCNYVLGLMKNKTLV